jgi:hypothetical protein
MAEKIGEILVQEGLITQSELEEALKSQVIYGGRLDTNLIEMGLISEEDFGGVLSRLLKVPYFAANELRDIPQGVIDSLPTELAEKYKVVPLRLENRRLTLVMADPSDLRIIDEISFRTGMLIRPAISSELWLVHALEKYYNVPREVRYISLTRSVPAVKKRAAQPTTEIATSTPSIPPAAKPMTAAQTLVTSVSPAAEPGAPAPTPNVPILEMPALAVSSVDAAAESAPDDIFGSLTSVEETTPVTLETVALRLVEANDREDIADAAISWLGGQFQRSALFLVRGETASGWHAVSDGKVLQNFDLLRIPLNEPSALKTVAENRSPILGPLQRSLYNSMLLQELGGAIPKTALLLPLLMLGRITAILYLDGPDTLLQEKMPELQKLTAKMIMAFDILMLKNKILML